MCADALADCFAEQGGTGLVGVIPVSLHLGDEAGLGVCLKPAVRRGAHVNERKLIRFAQFYEGGSAAVGGGVGYPFLEGLAKGLGIGLGSGVHESLHRLASLGAPAEAR